MLDKILKLPTVPAVLKQPLGCCGHGVFFVSTVEEILEKTPEIEGFGSISLTSLQH